MKLIRRLTPQLVQLAILSAALVLFLQSRRACAPPVLYAASTSAARPPAKERSVRAPFYLKTHKTGSTTVAHHLLYYTRERKLSTLRAPGHILVSTPNPTAVRCDAIVAHHAVFNFSLLRSYMRREPDLLLTSVRLPLQRQVSWFQQQNRQFENVSCDVRDDALLAHFDTWSPKRAGPQVAILQEAASRDALAGDVDKILDQFDFIFIKERLKESFECFCQKTGIRLCHEDMPMVSKNVRGGTCAERQLLRYRAPELLRGAERDLLLYEEALDRLECTVSDYCRCPVL